MDQPRVITKTVLDGVEIELLSDGSYRVVEPAQKRIGVFDAAVKKVAGDNTRSASDPEAASTARPGRDITPSSDAGGHPAGHESGPRMPWQHYGSARLPNGERPFRVEADVASPIQDSMKRRREGR